eukprot:m.62316 g.62316  ORF g.62316 m.62316 type:complete len:84 (+) comp8078_c0_seq4:177-428(+)
MPKQKRKEKMTAGAGADEVVISELNSAADLLDVQALEIDFKDAVDYVSNTESAGRKLNDAQQRRLYGIHRSRMHRYLSPAHLS